MIAPSLIIEEQNTDQVGEIRGRGGGGLTRSILKQNMNLLNED